MLKRSRACTSTVAAFIIVVAIVAGLEAMYRWAGAIPSLVPGWTMTEFAWRLQNADLSKPVVVVGDSRVGWGLAEKPLERALRARHAAFSCVVNAGVAATSTAAILRYLMRRARPDDQVCLVLNFSSGAFYCFGSGFMDICPSRVTLQDYADDRIGSALQSILLTWEQDPRRIARQIRDRLRSAVPDQIDFVTRSVDPDGFVEAHLGTAHGDALDPRAYALDNYRRLFKEVFDRPVAARLRLLHIRQCVDAARQRGWRVAMIRLPISAEMLALENQFPTDLQFDRVADFLGVWARDYTRDPRARFFATVDGSHLTPDAARAFAPVLAEDLARWMNAPPAGRDRRLPAAQCVKNGPAGWKTVVVRMLVLGPRLMVLW